MTPSSSAIDYRMVCSVHDTNSICFQVAETNEPTRATVSPSKVHEAMPMVDFTEDGKWDFNSFRFDYGVL